MCGHNMAAYLRLLQQRIHQLHRRVFRDRQNPIDYMDDTELRKKYRLDQQTLLQLCNELQNDLQRPTKRSCALPVSLQVTIALRFYATSSFQAVLADGHGVCDMSVSRSIHSVSSHLAYRLRQRYIKQQMYGLSRFPKCVGVVDGTVIPILAPSDDEHLFVNRKGFHAFNVLGICDANNSFLNLVIRWPGSTHDSFVLGNSQIAETFESGQITDCWLLGDSAYPAKPWLLTPLHEPRAPAERRYNTAHKRTRCVIERTFGMWKMRFRCLHRSSGCLMFSPQ